MNFDRHKDDFDKIFEANMTISNNPMFDENTSRTKPKKSSSNSKEDKIDRLKSYDEYWNFEKNYHYNSKIDEVIKKINADYGFNKQEQIKLMKDVINQICGTAAKYLGLSWDMVGDDKYLFGFYETTGSKNHMQILIPYDFKFSVLKQKLLDWFLKKKESNEGDMNTTLGSKPKKPSIKIVESMTRKIKNVSIENVENEVDNSVLIKEVMFSKIESFIKNELGIPDASDEHTLLFGEKGRLSSFDKTSILRFTTERRFKWDSISTCSSTSELGCEFFLKFNDDNTFSFYVYIESGHYPQLKLFWLTNEYTVVVKKAECSPLRRGMIKNEFLKYQKPPVLENSIKNLNLLKSLISKFCTQSYKKVLSPLQEPWHYQDTDTKMYPLFEEFIFEMFTSSFKEYGIQSSMLNESMVKKVKNVSQSDIEKETEDSIFAIDFVNPNIELACIEAWGSERSKREGKFYISDARKVTTLKDADWSAYFGIGWHSRSVETNAPITFNELKYFTGIKEINNNDFDDLARKLTEITLPEGLERIGDFGLSSIDVTEIEIPSTVKEIGTHAFFMSDLQKVRFRENSQLKILHSESFYDCKNLSDIILPESLEYLGSRTFFKTNIQDINIPKNIKYIGGGALTNINCHLKENNYYPNINFDRQNGFITSKDGKVLMACECPISKSKIEIPEGVEEIGEYCFNGARLEKNSEIVFPSSLKKIGKSAFSGGLYHNTSPVSILHFNEGLEEIGEECFRDTYNITEMTLPSSLKVIGPRAFMHAFKDKNENFKTLDLSNLVNLEDIGNESFYQNHFKEIILPNPCKFKKMSSTFSFCYELEKCNIPEGVEELYGTFSYDKELEIIGGLPSTLKVINRPFDNCNKVKFEFETIPENWTDFANLENVTIKNLIAIPNEDGEIPKNKYRGLGSEILRVEEGTKIIPKEAFRSNNNIPKKIIIPSSIEEIGESAFSTNSETEVYFKSSKKMPKMSKSPFGWECTIFCDEKKYKSFTTSKKYQDMFRRYTIKLLGESNSNDWDEEFVEKKQYDEGLIGNLPYSFKFLERRFDKHSNKNERIYWRYHHNGSEEGIPEYKEWWTFDKYVELPVTEFWRNMTNLELKEKLNNTVASRDGLKQFLENFCNPTGRNDIRTRIKVIFNDNYEIDFNVICQGKGKAEDGSNRQVWKTKEFIFRLIFEGKDESPNFKDTEIERCLKEAEIKSKKSEKDYAKWQAKWDRDFHKRVEKQEKENEKRRKKREKEYEKQRIKEENRRQRELQRQMKKSGAVSSENVSESAKPWFMFDFDKHL